jgi:hypothetical protein
MAFATPSASAQIHVEQEIDPEVMAPCEPCPIHLESETPTILFVNGFVVYNCTEELEGEIYEDGSGHLRLTSATGPSCFVTPCQGTEAESPIQIEEDSGTESLTYTFCLEPGGGGEFHCSVEVDVADVGTHHWVLTSPGYFCANTPVQVFAQWEIEADNEHVNFEAAH